MAAITSAAIGVAAGITSGIVGTVQARKRRDQQNAVAATQQEQLDKLVAERPKFKNPAKNLTNAFADMSNPYANLTVATESFKQEAEQADIALANSLDVMMETGMGAGGATALAQAALQSKRGIAASINAQETQNRKLQAEGEANVAKMQAQGQENLNRLMFEGDTAEQKDAINFQEALMSRTATLYDNAVQNAADADAARSQGIMSTISSVGSGLGGIASAVASKK